MEVKRLVVESLLLSIDNPSKTRHAGCLPHRCPFFFQTNHLFRDRLFPMQVLDVKQPVHRDDSHMDRSTDQLTVLSKRL